MDYVNKMKEKSSTIELNETPNNGVKLTNKNSFESKKKGNRQ